MKRALISCLIASAATAAVADAAAPPRTQLETFVCRHASNQLNRVIAVTAVMRPVTGTERMAIKFEMDRMTSQSGSFVNVRGGDLNQWRHPSDPPTLGQQPADVWMLTKEVVTLQAPAVYRFKVTFRWTGSGGRVLQDTVRLSDRCSQAK
jgi:hypothetical protein